MNDTSTASSRDGIPKLRRKDLELLSPLAASGEIKPVIDRDYELDDAINARRHGDRAHKCGNVIVTVR